MKTYLLLVVFLLVSVGELMAQGPLPAPGTLVPTERSSDEVTSEIDNLLKVGAGDIMNGIEGYGLNWGEAIKQKVMDEIFKAIADAVVLAPAAEKILSAYQATKNSDLASAIDAVKTTVKVAMSTQLKVRYQNYKVKFEKSIAGTREKDAIKNSTTENRISVAKSQTLPRANALLDEFGLSPAKLDMLRSVDPNLAASINGAVSALAASDVVDAKLAVANQEYTAGGASEVVQLTPYQRVMMKRDADRRMQAQLSALRALHVQTRTVIAAEQYKRSKEEKKRRLGLPQPY